MRALLFLGHFLGFVLWLGGGLAAMQVGTQMRSAGREESALLLSVLVRLYRGMLLPGAVLTVLTGLLLTLRLYGGAVSVAGYPTALMVMQGTGLLGAAILIAVGFPAAIRLARLDPTGPHADRFQSLRRRVSTSGGLTGVLALIALVAAALLR